MNNQVAINMRMSRRLYLTGTAMHTLLAGCIILLASILYVGSVYQATAGQSFRLDSDYDSNFPIVSYVVDTVRGEHRFPLRNPYVTSGISVPGDPFSGVLYLPYLLPMLLFGIETGWRVVIVLHAFLAGVFMWRLLRELQGKKSGDGLPLWGGLLYMGSGAFAARVAAGHIEKVLSYSWYPLFISGLLATGQARRPMSLLIGAVMGIVFLTGDVYGLMFMAVFYGVVVIITIASSPGQWFRAGGEVVRVMLAFIAVAAVKLIPFLTDVLPVIARYGSFEAAKGSLHVVWAWVPFVVPWGAAFYDRMQFQGIFGFWYNWYEYYAFIGPPIIFLTALPAMLKRNDARMLVILFATGLMYISRGHPYSVFYWLEQYVPVVSWFRAPQRMYEAMTSIIVILVTLSARRVIKRKTVWLATLAVVLLVNGHQMTNALEKPRTGEDLLVRQLAAVAGQGSTVATFSCCMQTFLIAKKIRIVNYYYGWRPKNALRYVTPATDEFDLTALEQEKPSYIIAPKDMMFGRYGYEIWFGDGNNVVWRVSKLS
jgi:hypothetical protein